MKISCECFEDSYIADLIIANGGPGHCDILNKDSKHIYDTKTDSYLEPIFVEVLEEFVPLPSIYIKDPHLKWKIIDYFNSWRVFSKDSDKRDLILKSICPDYFKRFKLLFMSYVIPEIFLDINKVSSSSIFYTYNWEEFAKSIKHKYRFHNKIFNSESFNKILPSINLEIKKNELCLYRCRINDLEHYDKGFGKKQMRAPNWKKANDTRICQKGIKCLYLSNDVNNCIKEVRAYKYDSVSVAEFYNNKVVKLADFSMFSNFSIFNDGAGDVTWRIINYHHIHKIAEELSKPLRRVDSKIEYVPIQYICDYVKYSNFDGIKYRSTFSNKFFNYAIFRDSKFSCKDVCCYFVKNISLDCEK